MSETRYSIENSPDSVGARQRVVMIRPETAAAVDRQSEDMVMTFPHLVGREIIVAEWLVIILSLVSLWFDAPLEGLADPNKTPNPAKAPWYFLGLQELLYYFPPVLAGILIPALVLVGLVVIPYFDINIRREMLWGEHKRARLTVFTIAVSALVVLLAVYRAYVVLVPTLIMSALMTAVYFLQGRENKNRFLLGLTTCSVAAWTMTWFVVVSAALTITGTFFRGPGWSFVWPWK